MLNFSQAHTQLDKPYINPMRLNKRLKHGQKLLSTPYVNVALKTDTFPFNYKIHANINLILRAYFLELKSCTEIAQVMCNPSIDLIVTAQQVRRMITKSNCTLRSKNYKAGISFTKEQINFLQKQYFQDNRPCIGILIVRFNYVFSTRKTYLNIQMQLNKMHLWNDWI